MSDEGDAARVKELERMLMNMLETHEGMLREKRQVEQLLLDMKVERDKLAERLAKAYLWKHQNDELRGRVAELEIEVRVLKECLRPSKE